MNKILFMFRKELVAITMCLMMKTGFSQAGSKQGLEGYVYVISGNLMPAPHMKPHKPRGFQTMLYIFQLTNLRFALRQGESSFYTVVETKLCATVDTDSSGHFRIELPPGRYSLFVKKERLFFANWFDKDNNIAPAEVLPGKFSRVEFTVDYDAVY